MLANFNKSQKYRNSVGKSFPRKEETALIMHKFANGSNP